MDRIQQTISSVEVAEMVGKAHNKLMRDIREYIDQLAQSNLGHDEFFNESTYVDNNNRTRPCYQITKKGCEFIAHKLTGVKGTEFTAKYIDRFHTMEQIIVDHIHKERTITNPDESIRITRTTMVTGKGQQYFINKLLAVM